MFRTDGKQVIENMREPFRTIIKDIAERSKAYKAKFILFGSCARGNPSFRSDIDLFICFPDDSTCDERVAVCDEFDDDTAIPPVNVMSGIESKLENSDSLFMRGLRRDGIPLNF